VFYYRTILFFVIISVLDHNLLGAPVGLRGVPYVVDMELRTSSSMKF